MFSKRNEDGYCVRVLRAVSARTRPTGRFATDAEIGGDPLILGCSGAGAVEVPPPLPRVFGDAISALPPTFSEMVRHAACLAALALLAGCGAKPISDVANPNGELDVVLLTRIEDCRVYRFEDWRTVYVTVCGQTGASTASSHSESCGKNCTRTVDDVVETVRQLDTPRSGAK